MTDKVQKIREEVARIQLYTQSEVLKQVLDYIDEVQKEPVSDRLAFKAIPRLLEMIEPTDRAKSYTVKLADALEVEGYSTDAKIVRESLKIMNGDKVPMATMDGEPVSEKKCIFTKDNYTDEDRKVLCDGCKEKCSKKEEPVSIDFEQELYKAFGQVKDFTLGMRIAKWFYNIGKNSQEPVSEDLEEAAIQYAKLKHTDANLQKIVSWDFKDGAKWQKEQLMKNTADAVIGLPYENKDGGYTHLVDVSRPLPVGNNKIAIIFKED